MSKEVDLSAFNINVRSLTSGPRGRGQKAVMIVYRLAATSISPRDFAASYKAAIEQESGCMVLSAKIEESTDYHDAHELTLVSLNPRMDFSANISKVQRLTLIN